MATSTSKLVPFSTSSSQARNYIRFIQWIERISIEAGQIYYLSMKTEYLLSASEK